MRERGVIVREINVNNHQLEHKKGQPDDISDYYEFDIQKDLLGYGATGRVYKANLIAATDENGKALKKDGSGNFIVEDDKGNETPKRISGKWAVKSVSKEWASSNPQTAALMGFEIGTAQTAKVPFIVECKEVLIGKDWIYFILEYMPNGTL